MIKRYKKILFAVVLFLSCLMQLDSAVAVESKTAQITDKSNDNSYAEDPDLKLSIEELKKKYPITWLKRKYGDYRYCAGPDDEFTVDEEHLPKNLICSFIGIGNNFKTNKESRRYKKMHFKDFSESQIKSIFVNYDPKQGDDMREWHVVGLVFEYFDNKPEEQLTDQEKSLKKFIFLKRISYPFGHITECAFIMENFDMKTPCSSLFPNQQ